MVSDERNSYTYDSLGELVQTNGAVNSSYTYDSRGNMLSKAVNGETTTFEYGNTQWQDQLTSVNGKTLTYDANGNLKSYDGVEYTWSHGKQLSSITNGDSTFKYQYDLNGIRSYKTVNGVTTKFDTLNGKILAQSDKNNKILFQYNGDTPIGFELNETQYFYLTNLSGDVVGITDADGNLIARYSYDEWGKLLSIETAENGNAEQQNIAELNPLRYRGYYYDNETGMYYLQSRYYNPELCRFISADGFEYADTSGELNANLYMYCWNNAVTFKDVEGTTPKLAISFEDIVVYFVNLGRKIKDKVDESANKTKNKINKLVSKWDKSIKTHYNAFIDKLEYAINYPDVVINNVLSKIGVKDFKVRFRLLEYLREQHNFKINLSKYKKDIENDENGISLYYAISEDEKTDNWFEAAVKVLTLSLQVNGITRFFESLVKLVNENFDLNKWFEGLSSKSQNIFIDISIAISTMINTAYRNFAKQIDDLLKDFSFDKWVEYLFKDSPDGSYVAFVNIFIDSVDIFSDFKNGSYSVEESMISFIFDTILIMLPLLAPESKAVEAVATVIKLIYDNSKEGWKKYKDGHFWG